MASGDEELIREAAQVMRQRAKAATAGPWESLDDGDRLVAWKLDPSGQFDDDFDYVVDEPISNAANAEHIASWHPGVALAVARWLKCAADLDPSERHYTAAPRCGMCGDDHVVDVAGAYFEKQSP
jgi:hypothetical protein